MPILDKIFLGNPLLRFISPQKQNSGGILNVRKFNHLSTLQRLLRLLVSLSGRHDVYLPNVFIFFSLKNIGVLSSGSHDFSNSCLRPKFGSCHLKIDFNLVYANIAY